MTNKTSERESAQIIDAGLGELNKVRDILFGREVSKLEQRFSQLEKTLETKLTNVRDSINSQLKALEESVNAKVSVLSNSLETESAERQTHLEDAQKKLNSAIQSSQQLLAESINKAEDIAQQDLIELRTHIETQQQTRGNEVAENMDQLRNELTKLLARKAETLQDSKLDKESLALMFDEITVRLRKNVNK